MLTLGFSKRYHLIQRCTLSHQLGRFNTWSGPAQGGFQCQTAAWLCLKQAHPLWARPFISHSRYPRASQDNLGTTSIPRPILTCAGKLWLKMNMAVIQQTCIHLFAAFVSTSCWKQSLSDSSPLPLGNSVVGECAAHRLNWEPWILR